jgi:uncharacterized protein (TIGR02466 family)
MNYKIDALFSEPISIINNLKIDDSILVDQLKNIDLNEIHNKGTFISNSRNVLNDIEYGKKLKNKFNEATNKTLNELGFNACFKIYTSWLTLTKPGVNGHSHYHSNYWWSGCYYPSYNNKKVSIIFNRPNKLIIDPNKKHLNCFNRGKVELKIETNTLILFPSYIEHQIGYNDSDENRISLAFNINPVGKVGEFDSEYVYGP